MQFIGKTEVARTVLVEYACGHQQVHAPAGDLEEYRKRIAKIDCGMCDSAANLD